MARKPTKARARKASAKKTDSKRVKATPSETMAVPSEAAFKKLLSAIKGAEADKNEAVGTIGSLVSGAVEKNHLDKKAFGIFRTLARMSDNKLATTLAHLDHYREIGGLDERAANQGQMFERTELSEGEPPDLGEDRVGTVPAPAEADDDGKVTGPKRVTFAQKLRDAQPVDPVKESVRNFPGYPGDTPRH